MIEWIPINDPRLVDPHLRPLGTIEPGRVYAWEPGIYEASEFVIVSKIEGHDGEVWVHFWNMEYKSELSCTEGMFREACVRTRFKPFPIAPPHPGAALFLQHSKRGGA